MGLENLLDFTKKQFQKKFKQSDAEFRIADKVAPPTGIIVDNPLLEFILDRRFLAYGKCYLLYGKKGNSKTTLLFDLFKLFQKHGGDAIWIETERAADLDYAASQGVDTKRLAMPEVHSLQEALTTVELLIKNLPKAYPDGNTPVIIGLDSIAGASTEYELQDGVGMGEYKVGEHARIMSGFYRQIVDPLSYEKCIFVALNQLKDKIGGMSFGTDPAEALIGGEAQRFHSVYQWKVDRLADLTQEEADTGATRKIGSKHQITCKRNKLGREGNSQRVEFDIYIKGGIDWYSPLVRKLKKEYNTVVTAHGGYVRWEVPNTHWKDPKTGEMQLISTEDKVREAELAKMIFNSTEAKEAIRQAFKIKDLPPEEIVQEIENTNKKRRGKKLVEEATPDDSIKVEL